MSFLSVLGKIGSIFTHVVDFIRPVEPYIAKIYPPFDVAFTIASDVERLIPDGQGPQKLAAVTSVLQATHPGIDVAQAQTHISKMVTGLNLLAEAEAALNALMPTKPAPAPAKTP